jgi:hypothetical protein
MPFAGSSLTRRIAERRVPIMAIETALVALLAPVLPTLLGAGKAIGQSAATAMGAEAADLARRVWERLHGTLAERPTAKSAADDVAADPDDETARETLEVQLRRLLRDDPKLLEDLSALLKEGERKGVFADRGAVVYHDVSVTDGAIFIGRDAGDVRQTR